MLEFPKKILLFGMRREKKKSIMQLCRTLHIPCQMVPAGRYLQPLGALAGVPFIKENHTYYDGEKFSRDMMVICGLSDRELDVFLGAYKEQGIETVDCKAVLTADNMIWTPQELFDELVKEHDRITGNARPIFTQEEGQ